MRQLSKRLQAEQARRARALRGTHRWPDGRTCTRVWYVDDRQVVTRRYLIPLVFKQRMFFDIYTQPLKYITR